MGARGSLLAGGELRGYDGPWDVPEDLRKVSGMLRYIYEGESSDFSLLALGYDSRWNASDQIPTRAVDGGAIGRFGQIDPTLGGETARYILSGRWTRSTDRSNQRVMVYGQRYDLDLFSNFTYQLDDPAAGDQIRQEDDARMTFGAHVAHLQALDLAGREHRVTVGAQARLDRADVTLSRTSARTVVSTVRQDDITQWSGGVYGELTSPWSDVFRTTIGLRSDYHAFDVMSGLLANTGTADDAIVSPKLSLAFGPWSGTELYLSGGLGFHSNAREEPSRPSIRPAAIRRSRWTHSYAPRGRRRACARRRFAACGPRSRSGRWSSTASCSSWATRARRRRATGAGVSV
jgi:hypothetical protein